MSQSEDASSLLVRLILAGNDGNIVAASSLSRAVSGDLKPFQKCFPNRPAGLVPGGRMTNGGLVPRSAFSLKGLILAQNERWRRGLGMQVERIPGATLGEVAKGAVRHG